MAGGRWPGNRPRSDAFPWRLVILSALSVDIDRYDHHPMRRIEEADLTRTYFKKDGLNSVGVREAGLYLKRTTLLLRFQCLKKYDEILHMTKLICINSIWKFANNVFYVFFVTELSVDLKELIKLYI